MSVRAEAGNGKSGGCRVLVVEDHEDIRLVLQMMIQAQGFEAATAASPEEALTLATEFMPDVILSDISLPQMDGCQLLEQLRRLPGLESVPAIALTGLSEHAEQYSAIQSRFEAVLSKPINYDLLFEKLDALTYETCSQRKI